MKATLIYFSAVTALWGAPKPNYPKVHPHTPDTVTLAEYVVEADTTPPVRVVVYVPKAPGKYPAILDIHGGGWQQNQIEADKAMMERFAVLGYVTALVDYRLAPAAKYPTALYDCKAAVRYLRAHAGELKIDPNHIGVIGGSAGGQLAALLAMTNGDSRYEGNGPDRDQSSAVQACVAMSATMDYYRADLAHTPDFELNFFGKPCSVIPETYRDGSPLYHVSRGAPPIIFLEGEKDSRKIGRPEMEARLREDRVETADYTLPGAPHPFWMSHPWIDQTIDIAGKFFARHLTTVTPGP